MHFVTERLATLPLGEGSADNVILYRLVGHAHGRMAAMENVSTQNFGRFHSKCVGRNVKFLDQQRRSVSGYYPEELAVAFSEKPIPNGWKFSVRIFQDSLQAVSPLSTSSRPHSSAEPYTAGGAVHVVHCCLFLVRSMY